ncbi:craniofacial development protein 2-like [Dreissena polymorpha]|uniref:craniofacial development protein 2-like n=1 Tax=Dreissena polymorpha TaxID=45954 RepID=UPI0022642CDB|nr:craniofacial development protein 2-like [Dreissena polymorpha]
MMSPAAANALMEWQPVSSRIMTARFNSKGMKMTIIQCYAPTNDSDEETKETFYDALQTVVDELPQRDIKLLMGDMNANIEKDNTGKKLIMGTQALGDINENGELFTDFCAFNDLIIGGSTFQHKDIHKVTCISPHGKTRNQIDYITITRKCRHSLQDTVFYKRGTDVASDHHLVMGVIKIKLRALRDAADRSQARFNIQRLKETDFRDTFTVSLKNRFEALCMVTEEMPLDEHWNCLRDTWKDFCQDVLGKKHL